MKKKHTYRSVEIKQVEIATLLALLTTLVVIVAIDVAKYKQLVAFCTQEGTCRQLVRFDHPSETSLFLDLLGGLVQGGKTVQVVLEPTGTYGDVLMYQCDQVRSARASGLSGQPQANP